MVVSFVFERFVCGGIVFLNELGIRDNLISDYLFGVRFLVLNEKFENGRYFFSI